MSNGQLIVSRADCIDTQITPDQSQVRCLPRRPGGKDPNECAVPPTRRAGPERAPSATAVGTTRDAVHQASTTRARHTTRTPNPTSTADSRSGSAALLGASGLGLSQRSRLHLRRYFIPTSRLTSTYDTDTRVTRPRSTDKGTSLYMHRIYVYFTVISRADYGA